jgi:hypothetical protein
LTNFLLPGETRESELTESLKGINDDPETANEETELASEWLMTSLLSFRLIMSSVSKIQVRSDDANARFMGSFSFIIIT